MNNRTALGLAVGAGYLLGRTKKAKFAFAVGTLVMGKRLNATPGALTGLVTDRLRDNPQFKELGDQLREDLRGVGKAATGALVNRRIDALADRLHESTLDVRDRISGVAPALDDDEEEAEDTAPEDAVDDEEDDEGAEDAEDAEDDDAEQRVRKPARKPARKTAKQQAPKQQAPKQQAPKKQVPKKQVPKNPKKKPAARRTAPSQGGRSRG
ncbi:DNA primase [Streptomyces syringium]|uniref:DNA primase n=1 Tax=Streptomyces syringium TaxID=76729 RepID=UPI003437E7C5